MKKLISMFLSVLIIMSFATTVFANTNKVNIGKVYTTYISNDTVQVYENGVISYVKLEKDEDNNLVSNVYNQNWEIIETYKLDSENKTITCKDKFGNVTKNTIDMREYQSVVNNTTNATEFCNVIGQKKGWYTVNIPWTKIILAGGIFVGVSSLIATASLQVGAPVVLSDKVVSFITSSIGLGLTVGGAVKTTGGIKLSGPKVCSQTRGGKNSYNSYSFSPQQVSVY